ncbi:RNA polymerase sigma-70 factor [Paludibacter sp. 221]|uniref:RNA polymerase sigma factor n=1 Tax=Paludibacter sp. 221 TaxID=2302939 RepID=UPI0013D4C8FE|nr:RNA polymerase sigma-70 factor [Paludibacter sp. 221]NDV46980.1 RNA polymerase sigma-70 factor [Paludibacter sp. 221]
MPRHLTLDRETDENDLFHLIRKGNKDAFTVVYEKYHKMLYVLAFRYLKDTDKAEDAVQNSFTKLWEFHSGLEVSVNLRNYLYTMTKNNILNQIRNETSALEKNYLIVQENDECDDSLVELIEKKELMVIFTKAVNSLPEQKRQVCLHKMEDKLSNQEIADKMDISVNTVKTHYAQSIKMLRVHIEKMLIFIFLLILS